jgi:hypothetical protein
MRVGMGERDDKRFGYGPKPKKSFTGFRREFIPAFSLYSPNEKTDEPEIKKFPGIIRKIKKIS